MVDTITETNLQDGLSVIDFTYDNRNRLTEEKRTGTHEYWRVYTYDKAGNRLSKMVKDVTSGDPQFTTTYTYDVSDPLKYGSRGDRLMNQETRDAEDPENAVVEQRWYEYNKVGNVTQVIRKIAGDVEEEVGQWYRGTRIAYDSRGQAWLTMSEKWHLDGQGNAVNCERLAAMEYRYDGGRKRYLVRPRDKVTLQPVNLYDGSWHDYDGNSIWGDYSVSMNGQTPVATDVTSHAPGLAQYVVAQPPSAVNTSYLHGNLVGTNEVMTDSSGANGVWDYRFADFRTSEDAQLHQMWDRLPSGSICVFDRQFSSFYNLAKLLQHGIDSISRLHHHRDPYELIARGTPLGDNQWIVWLEVMPHRRKKYNDPSLLLRLCVRLIRIEFIHKGRTKQLWLVTTLLDARSHNRQEIGELYRGRWEVEMHQPYCLHSIYFYPVTGRDLGICKAAI